MEKRLDPITGTVHLLDRSRPFGFFYLCICGKESVLTWLKTSEDTPLGCIVCLMHEKGEGGRKKS